MEEPREAGQGRDDGQLVPVVRGVVVGARPDDQVLEGVVHQESPEPQPALYSTGLLDQRQHAAVTRWAARLDLDKPLPGTPKVSAQLRSLGFDDRPVASLSTVVAAVVEDLLVRARPAPLEVALYALAIKEARRTGRRPEHRARGFSLPAELAGTYEASLLEASSCIRDLLRELWERARREHPGHEAADRREQYVSVARQLTERGLPERLLLVRDVVQIPAGTVARMAIDRLHRKAADTVVAMGVSFAEQWLKQPHRLRTDLLK